MTEHKGPIDQRLEQLPTVDASNAEEVGIPAQAATASIAMHR